MEKITAIPAFATLPFERTSRSALAEEDTRHAQPAEATQKDGATAQGR